MFFFFFTGRTAVVCDRGLERRACSRAGDHPSAAFVRACGEQTRCRRGPGPAARAFWSRAGRPVFFSRRTPLAATRIQGRAGGTERRRHGQGAGQPAVPSTRRRCQSERCRTCVVVAWGSAPKGMSFFYIIKGNVFWHRAAHQLPGSRVQGPGQRP